MTRIIIEAEAVIQALAGDNILAIFACLSGIEVCVGLDV